MDADGAGTNPAETVYTVYDGEHAWADFDASGNVTARYLFGDRVDEIIARWTPTHGTAWYLTDHQGTVRDIVDDSGTLINTVTYDSFGSQTNAAAGDRFTYTGREYDAELDLYYYRARFYDAQLGRFVSQDPIGFAAGDANLYRYVDNAPLQFIDPLGLNKGAAGGSGSQSDQALDAIAELDAEPVNFGTNTCEGYAFGLESLIRGLKHPGIAEVDVQAFALTPVEGAPCYVQLTLSTGHAAAKVTLQDGREFYYDNGAFGGDDGRFQLGDIPSYAYPGTPSLGILESFGEYSRDAYPPQPSNLSVFDPHGP